MYEVRSAVVPSMIKGLVTDIVAGVDWESENVVVGVGLAMYMSPSRLALRQLEEHRCDPG